MLILKEFETLRENYYPESHGSGNYTEILESQVCEILRGREFGTDEEVFVRSHEVLINHRFLGV